MKSPSRLSPAALAAFLLAGALTGAPRPREGGLRFAGLGDCERVTRDGAIPPSPHFWDPRSKTLRLHGARNEVVGAQLMLTATRGDVKNLDVEVSDLTGAGLIRSAEAVELFREFYGPIFDGSPFTRARGYTGPGSGTGVAVYPAPFRQAYDGHAPVPGEPPWSSDPNDWYRMREELAGALLRR